MSKEIHIIGGGTVSHVRSHLALCAPAYGTTAKKITDICYQEFPRAHSVKTHLTRMAGGNTKPLLETNEDISRLLDELIESSYTKIIFMSAAMCDFDGNIEGLESSKYANRLSTHGRGDYECDLTPAPKAINKIRAKRKDIFLVGFKTTTGKSEREQYLQGLRLCKEASCNLVLANDVKTRTNMIITPEEAAYSITTDRERALTTLVKMALARSELHFTRSTVVDGEPVSWADERVPPSLRTVVDHCIKNGAYKTFLGSTVGHFAVKVKDNQFLTSRRKSDFNKLNEAGLVLVDAKDDDSVVAVGSKPSVGGQSQRIVFKDHPEYDCIVHFHCPLKERNDIPKVSQKLIECGSHECGQNTSNGLKKFGNLSAVMLDRHGPNIVFNRNINPQEVIKFIDANFDLAHKTGGFDL